MKYSWVVRRCVYPFNEWREGTRILEHFRFLAATQYAPKQALDDLRFRKLSALLRHAFENVRFYRRRFREAGIVPDDIKSFEDLRRLPRLTKNEIASNLSDLVAENYLPDSLHRTASGGSTGRHTPFYRDNACLGIKTAAMLRFDVWSGWNIGEKMAHFWPAVQDMTTAITWKQRLRRVLVDRSLIVNAGNLRDVDLPRHAATLRAYSPVLIRAFPNPLSVLAKYLHQVRDQTISPRGVVTMGEPLLASQRSLFERVFQCQVFDCYASRECGQHACECEAHDGLHINAECLYLEFEDERGPVRGKQPGRILFTDLDNFGMPFIRYDMEDIGSPLEEACSCGRNLPRMSMQAGRVSDYVVSPYDGSMVFGASLCHYLLATGPDVGQIQIVQDARDHLTIRLVKSSGTGAEGIDVSHVQKVIDQLFHGAMRIAFEFCGSIPHAPSGKYRFCINEYVKAPASEHSETFTSMSDLTEES